MDSLKAWIGSLRFDFVGWARPVAIASFLLVVASWVLFFVKGPNWGIDFTGGTEVVLQFDEDIAIEDLRSALASLEIPNDAVQEVSGGAKPAYKIRIQDPEFGAHDLQIEVEKRIKAALGDAWMESIDFDAQVGARFSVIYKGDKTAPGKLAEAMAGLDGVKVEEGREERELVIKFPGLAAQVQKEIGTALGDRGFEVLSVDAVGPKVGESLRVQGVLSVVATLALILVYVAFRFDIIYAPGAVLALIHDVSVVMGLFIVFDKEFNLTIIGAMLTILGYSLNDTIVIYDRIRENRIRYSRTDLSELVNTSINETLTRTIATAGTTLVSTIAFLVIGTDVIRDFVLAITLGVVFGTYSTIYVASPAVIVTEKLKPRLVSMFTISPGAASAATTVDDDGIPEQFISDSAKRRSERAAQGVTDAVTPGNE